MAICTDCGAVGEIEDLDKHICEKPAKNTIKKPVSVEVNVNG